MYLVYKSLSPETELNKDMFNDYKKNIEFFDRDYVITGKLIKLIEQGGKFIFKNNIADYKLTKFFSELPCGCEVYFDETSSISFITMLSKSVNAGVKFYLGDVNQDVFGHVVNGFLFDPINNAFELLNPEQEKAVWISSNASKLILFLNKNTPQSVVIAATKALEFDGILELSADHDIDILCHVASLLQPGSLLKLRGDNISEASLKSITAKLNPYTGLVLNHQMSKTMLVAAARSMKPRTILQLHRYTDASVVKETIQALQKDCIYRHDIDPTKATFHAALDACPPDVLVMLWKTTSWRFYEYIKQHENYNHDQGRIILQYCNLELERMGVLNSMKTQFVNIQSLRDQPRPLDGPSFLTTQETNGASGAARAEDVIDFLRFSETDLDAMPMDFDGMSASSLNIYLQSGEDLPPTSIEADLMKIPAKAPGKKRIEANVAPKYAGGVIPELPHKASAKAQVAPDSDELEHNLELRQLKFLQTRYINANQMIKHQFSTPSNSNGLSIKFDFYTKNTVLNSHQQPIFIFAGRGENAFVPEIEEDSNIRIILVITQDEFEILQDVVGARLDMLVIRGLTSPTHGSYEKLGLLNSRRIAAFIFSMYLHQRYEMPYALMADDNIKQLHFKSESSQPETWDSIFFRIAEQIKIENTVCGSLATRLTHKVKHHADSELGSKIFMLDLERLNTRLGNEMDAWFMPFYPAAANAYWAEDYYFQVFFKELFQDKHRGYKILPTTQFAITRSQTHKNACLAVLRPIDAICNIDENIFGEPHLAVLQRDHQAFFSHIQQTLTTLKKIVKKNIKYRLKKLTEIEDTSLLEAHALANDIEYFEPETIAPPADDEFLTILSQKIDWLIDKASTPGPFQQILRAYQIDILNQLSTYRKNKVKPGQCCEGIINMATGTGKTYVQIYLAICALLTGSKRPVIIVTPQMSLVKQAYDDFIAVVQNLPEALISHAQILKVDSDFASISAEVLLRNKTLRTKSVVMIICQDSYKRLVESTDFENEHYKKPCMLLVDESHLIHPFIKDIYKIMSNAFIAELSATPKPKLSIFNNFQITYLRKKAVEDGQLAPCVVRRLSCNWSLDHVLEFIRNASDFIFEHKLPNGNLLMHYKGIIYVPNSDSHHDYSALLKAVLDNMEIPSFEINSDKPDCKKNLFAYKNYEGCEVQTKILICKGMGKVGFSDNETYWEIYLQNGSAEQSCQAAGRTMRLFDKDPKKVGYIVAFKDVKLELVFDKSPYYDAEVLEYFPEYQDEIGKAINLPSSLETPSKAPRREHASGASRRSSPVNEYGFLFFNPTVNTSQLLLPSGGADMEIGWEDQGLGAAEATDWSSLEGAYNEDLYESYLDINSSS